MKHQDMVDLKMDAPVEIRGSFRPIRTNVPGIEICEHMPRLAKMMDKFAIIRSLYGCPDQHASDLCLSGYPIGAKGRQDNHRTPRINNGGGRDHWPQVSCALRAGGGMRMGQVIGSTNRLGEVPQDRPIHYQEVFATLYRQLGIDVATTTIPDHSGRPQYLLEHLDPIRELV